MRAVLAKIPVLRRLLPKAAKGNLAAEPALQKLAAAAPAPVIPLKPEKTKKHWPDAAMIADDDPVWPSIRQTVLQEIWGEGFIKPGGVDYAFFLARNFSPVQAGFSLLDANAALGGPMLWIAKKFGLEAEGLELSESIQRGGKAFMAAAGAPGMVLRHYDPAQLDLKGRHFHFILLRETLHRIGDAAAYLNKLCDTLKERGQIQIADFAVSEDGDMNAFRENGEPVYPRHLDEILGILRARPDMEIRMSEDITDRYARELSIGWRRYLSSLSQAPPDKRFMGWILKEAQLWAERLEALQGGKVRLYRIHARRKAAIDHGFQG